MSKILEDEIGKIAAFVQARNITAKALCQAYGLPCCQGEEPCHADQIYRPEAEAVLSALARAGLLTFDRSKDLIALIQSALGTEETGDNLVAVAREAHVAEREWAAFQLEREKDG